MVLLQHKIGLNKTLDKKIGQQFDNSIFYVKLSILNLKEELIIETKEQNDKDLETLETIVESSNNKKARGQLKLLVNEDLDFLDWSKVDFKELIDIAVNSRDNITIDYLASLLEKRWHTVESEMYETIQDAQAYLISTVVENEMGEKFPEINERIQATIKDLGVIQEVPQGSFFFIYLASSISQTNCQFKSLT